MMVRRYFGRSAMAARWLLGFIAALGATFGYAADGPVAPEPPPPEPLSPEVEAPHQVAVEGQQRVRWLDPAVFTEISPLTLPDIGIRLPADQED